MRRQVCFFAQATRRESVLCEHRTTRPTEDPFSSSAPPHSLWRQCDCGEMRDGGVYEVRFWGLRHDRLAARFVDMEKRSPARSYCG